MCILPLFLVACNDGGSGGAARTPINSNPQIKSSCSGNFAAYAPVSFTYSNTIKVLVDPITSVGDILSVDIPEDAVSIGIVMQGTNSNYKIIDHGIILLDDQGNSPCMTGPVGNVPFAFNQVDFDNPPDGIIEDDPNTLINEQAPALFFPNNGAQLTLPAGTYQFPFAGIDAAFDNLEEDTYQPFVYYKVPTATPTTIRVNLFVAQGVRSGLNNSADAAADPEIQGAIQVLRNVYENDPDTALILDVTVDVVPSSYVSINSDSEQRTLFSSYPLLQPHDAVNLFVVGSIAYRPGGVVGLSAGIPGPFNRHGTVVSGVLGEYQDDGTGSVLGFTMAHELGHFLGLYHTSQTNPYAVGIIGRDPISDTPVCTTAQVKKSGNVDNCPDRTNVMFPIVDENPTPIITAKQGRVVRLNPGITDGTPPTIPVLSTTLNDDRSVTLTWTESYDDTGVAEYWIYRGLDSIARLDGSTFQFTDSNTQPGSIHDYFIRAIDNSGNLTFPSPRNSVAIPSSGAGGIFDHPYYTNLVTSPYYPAYFGDVDGDRHKDLIEFSVIPYEAGFPKRGTFNVAYGPIDDQTIFSVESDPILIRSTSGSFHSSFFSIMNHSPGDLSISGFPDIILPDCRKFTRNQNDGKWEVDGAFNVLSLGLCPDVNGDGIRDFLQWEKTQIINAPGDIDYFLHLQAYIGIIDGGYSPVPVTIFDLPANWKNTIVTTDDLDRNGLVDIILQNRLGSAQNTVENIIILMQYIPGVLSALPEIDITNQVFAFLSSDDITGDGYPELIGYAIGGNVQSFLNDGTGRLLYDMVDSGISITKTNIFIGDVNGDNVKDLLAPGGIYGINVFTSNGNGTFNPPTIIPGDSASISLFDIDEDGALDILSSSWDSDLGVSKLKIHYKRPEYTQDLSGIIPVDIYNEIEYSEAIDRIIASGPNGLHIIDPLSGSETSIALPGNSFRFSVSPDGTKAIAGQLYTNKISYINLLLSVIIKNIDTVFSTNYIALDSNKFAHILPRSQNNTYYSVNLLSNEIITNTSPDINSNRYLVSNTNEQSLYTVDVYSSSGAIRKFDISQGPANYLYGVDNTGCGNIWILNSGTNIINACGDILSVSNTQSDDLQYVSSLGIGAIQDLTTISGLNHVAIIERDPMMLGRERKITEYDLQTNSLIREISIPNITIGNRVFEVWASRIFSNSDGSRKYVVVIFDPAANLSQRYGIWSYQ